MAPQHAPTPRVGLSTGSGSGDFAGVSRRVAPLHGAGADAGDGTANISYDLVLDTAKG